MPTSQRIVQICLSILAAIGIFGGTVQMFLGQQVATRRRMVPLPSVAA